MTRRRVAMANSRRRTSSSDAFRLKFFVENEGSFMKRILMFAVVLTAAILTSCSAQAQDGVKVSSQKWEHNSGAFQDCSTYIAERADLNLLTFPEAKLVATQGVSSPEYLIDGSAGEYGGAGRVQVEGKPARIS